MKWKFLYFFKLYLFSMKISWWFYPRIEHEPSLELQMLHLVFAFGSLSTRYIINPSSQPTLCIHLCQSPLVTYIRVFVYVNSVAWDRRFMKIITPSSSIHHVPFMTSSSNIHDFIVSQSLLHRLKFMNSSSHIHYFIVSHSLIHRLPFITPSSRIHYVIVSHSLRHRLTFIT